MDFISRPWAKSQMWNLVALSPLLNFSVFICIVGDNKSYGLRLWWFLKQIECAKHLAHKPFWFLRKIKIYPSVHFWYFALKGNFLKTGFCQFSVLWGSEFACLFLSSILPVFSPKRSMWELEWLHLGSAGTPCAILACSPRPFHREKSRFLFDCWMKISTSKSPL